jgi:hypothetical protein
MTEIVTQIADIIRAHYPDFSKRESIAAGEEQGRAGRISPSKIVNGCLLAPYYDLIEAEQVKEQREYDNCMTLEVGKFLHEKLQKFFKEYYESIGWTYMEEVRVQITEDSHGSIDAVVMSPEMEVFLDEYKTCSVGVMDSLGKKPQDYNAKQAQIYMTGVECIHTRLLYVNRNNFQMKEYHVKPDKAVQDELLAAMHTVSEAAKAKVPPPPTVHWMGTSPCTKTCVYRHLCPENQKLGRKL